MPVSRDDAAREIAAVEDALRAGAPAYPVPGRHEPSALAVAAQALGCDLSRLRERIGRPGAPGRHERHHGIEVDWSLARDEASRADAPRPTSAAKPRVRVPYRTEAGDGRALTVLAIGDPHDKPELPKDRFRWIGRHAAQMRPDRIVCIGDWADLGSLSVHEPAGSQRQQAQTTFVQDQESLEESLWAFHRDLPTGEIPCDITFGNHEYRAWRAANLDPRRCSDLPTRVEQAFARCRWRTHEFGRFLNLGGVDFVHVPLNIMGREMGGEHLERSVAARAMRSVVMGHTHRRGMFSASKVGQDSKITCLNLGTAMPAGYVAPYARLSVTGWSYGVYLLRLQGGAIVSEKFWDMAELEELYRD